MRRYVELQDEEGSTRAMRSLFIVFLLACYCDRDRPKMEVRGSVKFVRAFAFNSSFELFH